MIVSLLLLLLVNVMLMVVKTSVAIMMKKNIVINMNGMLYLDRCTTCWPVVCLPDLAEPVDLFPV